jgi:4'-phosphopantetheinyl transferase
MRVADRLEIDLWFWGLSEPTAGVRRLEAVLSEDEKERMARFKFAHDQLAFLLCRARLRRLLARYTRTPPADIRFGEVGRGKPTLIVPHDTPAPAFNLSHTDGLACLAVSTNAPSIGVDIERIRPIEDDFSAYALTKPEAATVHTTRKDQRDRAFFHHWTGKEAFLKGPGEGLWQSLETFDVAPDIPATIPASATRPVLREADLPRIDDHAQREQGWRLFTFDVGPEFVGALAVLAGHDRGREIIVRSRFLSRPSAPVRKPR